MEKILGKVYSGLETDEKPGSRRKRVQKGNGKQKRRKNMEGRNGSKG